MIPGLDALVAFAEAHPLADYPPGLPRRLMAELSRGPEGVWDLRAGQGRLLAALIERVEVHGGAAILELLAGSGLDEPGARRALVAEALARAEALVGRSRPLHVPMPHGWLDLDDLLISNDLIFDHLICDMETPEGQAPPVRPTLPDGLRWALAEDGTFAAYYEVLQRAFAGRPDVAFPAFEVFVDMARGAPITPRLLMQGGSVVGFVNVGMLRPGLGMVRSIGRDPAHRGQGVGRILLAEAMALLNEAGATRYNLSVLATNTAALRLYQDAGFVVVREERVFARG